MAEQDFKLRWLKCYRGCQGCQGYRCVDVISMDLFMEAEWYSGTGYDEVALDDVRAYLESGDVTKPLITEDIIKVAEWVYFLEFTEGLCSPIEIDTYASYAYSGITDGDSKLRSLQLLGYRFFPAAYSGPVALLRKVSRRYYRHEIEWHVPPE